LYNKKHKENYILQMKKIIILTILTLVLPANIALAENTPPKPSNFNIIEKSDSAELSWNNPDEDSFIYSILFRSPIPIAEYFTFEAVMSLCDKVYEGKSEEYIDNGLKENLPYYYILFASYGNDNYSQAQILEKRTAEELTNLEIGEEKKAGTARTTTLAGATSITVNQISLAEATNVYSFNKETDIEISDESSRLALFIIVKSPHDLTDNDKNAISYFIHEGTPTTIVLGGGERAGVLNSYLSVFNKLPTNTLEWQDIIKIANGRWPNERSENIEEIASKVYFKAIYKREANLDNTNDNAAVTVIAYGLRPGNRNLESEKNAIKIFESIFNKAPSEAGEWDMVRAIAYSGAVR
jgi:hypothetical protein